MPRHDRAVLVSILIGITIWAGCKNQHPADGTLQNNSATSPQIVTPEGPGPVVHASAPSQFVQQLVQRLATGQDIAPLMSTKFEFSYHADNRCEGSTSGKIGPLPAARIDAPIQLLVTNDGQAWACNTKAPSTYEMDFNLKTQLLGWDRFEATLHDADPELMSVEGAGESDYLLIRTISIGQKTTIRSIEYRSEDPG